MLYPGTRCTVFISTLGTETKLAPGALSAECHLTRIRSPARTIRTMAGPAGERPACHFVSLGKKRERNFRSMGTVHLLPDPWRTILGWPAYRELCLRGTSIVSTPGHGP